MVLRLLSEVAADVGLEPMAFTRLSEARRAMQRRIPRVLVVDDDLPDGKGADLVREMRKDPALRDVTVVFCTSAGPLRRQEISELAPVVSKPFALADVERVLREAAAG